MPHLVVSALSIKPGRIGGAEYMIRNLVAGCSSLTDLTTTVVSPNHVSGWPASVNVHSVPPKNRFIAETAAIPGIARMLNANAVLFPNYFTPPRLHGVKTATVIPDLLYRRIPEVTRLEKRLWLRCCHRLTVERAAVVIALSTFAADDLRQTYGPRIGRRVVTIPAAIDWNRFNAATVPGAHPLGGRDYLLSVAAEWPHKNVATLVRAFKHVQAELGGCALVLVGQTHGRLLGRTRRQGSSLRELIISYGLENDVFQTGHVTDAELGAFYRDARAFVLPSRFEGFGMPAVEALGMGLPVITTRCGALPEATRNLALYVNDPIDAEELGRVVAAVIREPGRFAPSPESVREIRDYYEPRRIAALYRDAIFGTS